VHLVIVHQAFATTAEAGGTRHYEFARYLAGQGHRVTVIAGSASYLTGNPSAGGWETPFPGITVSRPRSSVQLHRSFIHRLIAYLEFMLLAVWRGWRVRDPDVVLGTSPPIFQGLAAWLVARTKGVPFLFEIRDLWPDFAVQLGIVRNRGAIALARLLERRLYKAADQLIVNSPGFVKHVQKVSGRTPIVIPNGVDPSMFEPPRNVQSVRAEWKAEEKFVILYAGAHGMANDLDCLLSAAKMLQSNVKIAFVLVGDGKEKQRLSERVQREALDNVTLMPAQPKERMVEVLAAADACVAILRDIPLFGTTYPNKVFDYMAAGKPIILAIAGVVREVVLTAGCGICVQPGDSGALAAAVRTLSDDRNLAQEMGARGRAHVCRHFDRREQAKALEALLEKR
jgi:glycosyltransferase involved in cell wall biosynthesis